MKQILFLFFIVSVISLVLIFLVIFFTNVKSTSQTKKTLQQPTKEVLALMQASDSKNEQVKKLLSKEQVTNEDQIKVKQLLQEALTDAKKATEMQPQSPETWYFLSQIYKELIDINPKAAPLAEDAMKKTIELKPENPKLYDDLATIYIMAKKYTDAEAALQKTIAIDPKRANPYFKLGNIYKNKGDKEKAHEFYLKAKELTPATHTTSSAMIDIQLKSLEK